MKRFIKATIVDSKNNRALLELDVQKKSKPPEPSMEIGATTAGFLSKQRLFEQKEERKKILNHYRNTSKQLQK